MRLLAEDKHSFGRGIKGELIDSRLMPRAKDCSSARSGTTRSKWSTYAKACGSIRSPASAHRRGSPTFLNRSEEHTSELQSHLISYAVFCLKKKNIKKRKHKETMST